MGEGVAQVAAQGGYQVIIRDLQRSLIDKGLHGIEKSLLKSVAENELASEEKDRIMSRITGVTDLSEVRDADMVIEAIIENLSIKKQVFAELDNLCSDQAILATNTSSLSITEIASATKHPERVIGMHFFYPVPSIKLVEVVKGIETSAPTVERTLEVVENMGKKCILVERDSPGFVVNRILAPMINEAIWVYGDGLASKEDIDLAMKLILDLPQGPLELADEMGLDSIYSVVLLLYNEFRDPKYRPHPLLANLVKSGHCGRKVGKGFYNHNHKHE
jgi:3-hydroxybutyryl-CoA dehydrogenase